MITNIAIATRCGVFQAAAVRRTQSPCNELSSRSLKVTFRIKQKWKWRFKTKLCTFVSKILGLQSRVFGFSKWVRIVRPYLPAVGIVVRLLCLLCVVQIAASATSWPLVHRNPAVCVCQVLCDVETLTIKRPTRLGVSCHRRKKTGIVHSCQQKSIGLKFS